MEERDVDRELKQLSSTVQKLPDRIRSKKMMKVIQDLLTDIFTEAEQWTFLLTVFICVA